MKYLQEVVSTPMITGDDMPPLVVDILVRATPCAGGNRTAMERFIRSVLGASLDLPEKAAVLAAVSANTRLQMRDMEAVFHEEQESLRQRVHSDWLFLSELSARNWLIAMMLAEHHDQGRFYSPAAERAAMQRMLCQKYHAQPHWVTRALTESGSALVRHVYGAFQPESSEAEVPNEN